MARHILFVCLGNICRSPMAEGAARMMARDKGLDIAVDSAGTGRWHIGKAPDARAVSTAAGRGADISGLRARQVQRSDFDAFDCIIAMDRSNLTGIRQLAPAAHRASISLLLDHSHDRQGHDVADPYYGSIGDFAQAWDDITAGLEGFLQQLADRSCL